MSVPLRISLTLDRMKYGIIQAVARHNDELMGLIEAEIDRQIAAFDFEKEVAKEVERAIAEAVGAGVKGLIGWQLQDEIQSLVRQTLVDRLNRQEETP